MTTKIHDDDGNEIHQVIVNVCVPAEYVSEAREIASAYMRDVERVQDWRPENQLTTPASPNGQFPATHYICSNKVLTPQVASMAAWIAGCETWCSNGPRKLTDNLTDSFCVCIAKRADFLTAAGLQVIA